MKPYLICLLLAILSLTGRAQDYSIKGSVSDTTLKVPLTNTSVSVLNAKDSTLVKFTRATATGEFALKALKAGDFILLVTYPDYADYVEKFSLTVEKPAHDFGTLNLLLKERLLKEVMITGNIAAMKINGDTTEFNPKAFVTQPNAKVEDLLRQLPGIQVDKDGKITAQGQTVSKVLVDGEEFFGDDPTLVTKNLRADMVDKVQLFDKKSDQAAFTGVDDGVRNKTLNIKLKEESKRGYFGKADAGSGGGTDDYYQGQLMFNLFKGKKKFAAYGTTANTGQLGLSWEDTEKYSSSGSGMEMIDGGLMIGGDWDDMGRGNFYGEGVPRSRNAGVHYDTKWKNDKHFLNLNYKVNALEVDVIKNNITQNNLQSGTINSNSDQTSLNKTFRQKLDVLYQVTLDTATNLKIIAGGTLKNSDNRSVNVLLSRRQTGSRANSSNRTNTNEGDQEQFNFSALLTRRLKKPGRTVSLNVSEVVNNQQTEGFLNSSNVFYDEQGIQTGTQDINQYKTTDMSGSVLNTMVTYTEPLSKTLSLVFNYGLALNNSTADRRSFNQSAPGTYDILDPVFSNDYELDQLSNQGGAVFSYRKNKTIVQLGSKATHVKFDQTDLLTDQRYERSFVNWLPQASYQYRFSARKALQIRYNGYTSQPSIAQIQPVRVNDDPLNVVLGNADLDPSFRNSFNLNYNSYKVISDRSIYLNGSYSFTNNAIASSRTTDRSGRSTIQSVNLKGKSPVNYYLTSSFSRKLKALGDINLELWGSLNGNTSYGYITEGLATSPALNKSDQIDYFVRAGIGKYREKKFSIYATAGPGYNVNRSSLQAERNANGRTWSGYSWMNFFLPRKVELAMNVEYTYRSSTAAFANDFEQLYVVASISKKFLKTDALKLSMSGNDLFNQRAGFNRVATGNLISQDSYNNIRRYFLFSLSYDFSKMGGAPAK